MAKSKKFRKLTPIEVDVNGEVMGLKPARFPDAIAFKASRLIPTPQDGKDGASIRGPRGERGRDGESIKGDRGLRGERGLDGKDGESIKGERGAPGRDGKDGESIKGDRGMRGPRGERGRDGESIRGSDGAKGDKGINWRGEWDSEKTYFIDDAVSWDGSSHICVKKNKGQNPSLEEEWDFLAQRGANGASIKGDRGADGVSITGPQGPPGEPGQDAVGEDIRNGFYRVLDGESLVIEQYRQSVTLGGMVFIEAGGSVTVQGQYYIRF